MAAETSDEDRRANAELDQILADTRLKLVQSHTEFWKIGIALVVASVGLTTLILRVADFL